MAHLTAYCDVQAIEDWVEYSTACIQCTISLPRVLRHRLFHIVSVGASFALVGCVRFFLCGAVALSHLLLKQQV